MNIQNIINDTYNNGEKLELINILNSSHTDYIPYNGSELNQMLYDIIIPEETTGLNSFSIKVHNGQQTINDTVHIHYHETPEANLKSYMELFEGYSTNDVNRYKILQRRTIEETQETYPCQPLIISVTKRLHYRVLNTINKERFFNRMIKFAQNTWVSQTPRTTFDKAISCQAFQSSFEQVPSLYHTLILYIHRNLKRSNMTSMTKSKDCSCDHAETLFAIKLPFKILMEIWNLHLTCSKHYEQTNSSCNLLEPKRFFIRKDSSLEKLLQSHSYNLGQFLFSRWELKEIRMQAFNKYDDDNYTKEQDLIMHHGISEIETYK